MGGRGGSRLHWLNYGYTFTVCETKFCGIIDQ